MKTFVDQPTLDAKSWSEDLTPSQTVKQQYLYIQCYGQYLSAPGYRIVDRAHLHSYLFLYTNSGMGILEYQGKTVTLMPGSLVMINCEHLHSYSTFGEEVWDFHWIHFCGSCIDGYISEIYRFWDATVFDTAGDYIQKLLQYTDYSVQNNDLLCSTALINLCTEYLLHLKCAYQDLDFELYPFVKSAMDYLQENFSKKITLDTLCAELHVSKSYLGHIFKEQLGTSPYEYLMNTRLSFAKTLLRNSDHTIAKIAEDCGFYSSSYFVQNFKKHEKMTPLQYRRYFRMLENSKIPYET